MFILTSNIFRKALPFSETGHRSEVQMYATLCRLGVDLDFIIQRRTFLMSCLITCC